MGDSLQKGEKIDVESIVSDIEGKLIAGRDIEIKAVLKRIEGEAEALAGATEASTTATT